MKTMIEKVIELHDEYKMRNTEICKLLTLSPGKVAGIIWRWKNPGMYKKNVKNSKR